MNELGEFDEDYEKKQRELAVEQAAFEYEQKKLNEELPEIEKKEAKKDKLISWGILAIAFLFILYLAYKLLF